MSRLHLVSGFSRTVCRFSRTRTSLITLAVGALGLMLALAHATGGVWTRPVRAQESPASGLFQTADNCVACHNGLTAPSGEDVSFGSAWRASMMANSARDPYWQASVRREAIDHPKAADEIQDECSVCHMPMARTTAASMGRRGEVFAHLPIGEAGNHEALLAADGVSCTACHQITADRFGSRDSFSGGFAIDTKAAAGQRPLFGPYPIESGRTRIMHSATGFRPAESAHVRQSELCATCHTLFTKARGPDGEVLGELPEQVPYLEWRHSAYANERSCQACHMPVIEGATRVSSVLGEPRTGAARHDFRGGNFFMLRMLNRFRDELAVQALPQEMDAAARLAVQLLQNDAARLQLRVEAAASDRLLIDATVENLTGHKLPTAYPSRRVWIHLTVRDQSRRLVFESGAVMPTGAIEGNDNDLDPARFEPHYREITTRDQVQIYESMMGDAAGRVTTGLLSGVRYLKDNRLLPRGFDKTTAPQDIAVVGGAAGDPDFEPSTDRVRYAVALDGATGPFTVEAELRYQPIGFRWAENLRKYDALEPRRFVQYFESMSSSSSEVLARAGVQYAR